MLAVAPGPLFQRGSAKPANACGADGEARGRPLKIMPCTCTPNNATPQHRVYSSAPYSGQSTPPLPPLLHQPIMMIMYITLEPLRMTLRRLIVDTPFLTIHHHLPSCSVSTLYTAHTDRVTVDNVQRSSYSSSQTLPVPRLPTCPPHFCNAYHLVFSPPSCKAAAV